jgi:hypothetical protein
MTIGKDLVPDPLMDAKPIQSREKWKKGGYDYFQPPSATDIIVRSRAAGKDGAVSCPAACSLETLTTWLTWGWKFGESEINQETFF